ncbi:hypothetical protein BSKO_12785 [Bryopsis sp. KO-2023]|nr:hypothetical protein BSKO_12785 [Bryopsis sp. KO-2023]
MKVVATICSETKMCCVQNEPDFHAAPGGFNRHNEMCGNVKACPKGSSCGMVESENCTHDIERKRVCDPVCISSDSIGCRRVPKEACEMVPVEKCRRWSKDCKTVDVKKCRVVMTDDCESGNARRDFKNCLGEGCDKQTDIDCGDKTCNAGELCDVTCEWVSAPFERCRKVSVPGCVVSGVLG